MTSEGVTFSYECPNDLKQALETITRKNEDVEDIIWITILSIVRHMFFKTDETVFSVEREDATEITFSVNLKDMQNNNFFTVVKYVKECMSSKVSSEKKNIKLCRTSNNIDIEECPLQFIRHKERDVTKFYVHYNNKVIISAELQNFMKILFQSAIFLTQNPRQMIKELNQCFKKDYDTITNVFNATYREYPDQYGIYHEFRRQVELFGERPALSYKDKVYTYKNIYKMICQQMSNLKANGVRKGDLVGIFLNDKLEQIINIFAIFGCGGAYLPIEVTYPEKRIAFMLEDAKVKYVVASKKYKNYEVFHHQVIDSLQNLQSSDSPECVDYDGKAECGEDMAYIMYTSGSTGVPRGVAIKQKSILRLVKNNDFLHITEDDRVLQTSTIVFDASIIEIYGALLNGACFVLSEKEDIIEPAKIQEIIQKQHITVMWLSSPLFTQLASQNACIFNGLHHLMVGGDVLSPHYINLVRQNNNNLEVINGYGPTENTTFSTTFSIKQDYSNSIPIGKPISNSTAYILNDKHELLPIGAIGEICVGGDGVAIGYLNNEELNRQKFIDNPFGEGKLYLTGDNGYWTEEGIIEFVGRKDYQFKINGFRVETGEIENAVSHIPGVELAFALVETIQNQKKIVLLYSGDVDVQIIKKRLKEEIPMYMFPNIILKLDKIPLNVNGKLNRGIIRELLENRDDEKESKEQLNEYETIISDVVDGMSNMGHIKLHDNLIEMSFDSLRLAMLITRLNETFHSSVRFSQVFAEPTIFGIAQCVQSGKNGKENVLVKEPLAKRYLASSMQKGVYYACSMDVEGTSYNVPVLFRFKNKVDIERIEKTWKCLIERHEILRTHFKVEDGELYQFIEEEANFHVVHMECKETELYQCVAEKIRKFDLGRDSLIRVFLFHTEKSLYMLVDMHHIIMDGFSIEVLFGEFCQVLRGEELPECIWQNKDVIYSKRLIYDEKVLEQQKQFWLSAMKDYEIADDIVTDYRRIESSGRKGIEKAYKIGEYEISEAIRKYSIEHNSTVFSILLSALYLTIYKYSRKDNVIAGIPFSGRTLSGMNEVIGMFVNVMPLKVEIDKAQKIEDFIESVKNLILQGYENQEYQFDTLVEELHVVREKNRNPLFNFSFNVDTHEDEFKIDEGDHNELVTVELNYNIVKYDFSIVVLVTKDKLTLKIQFDNSLYQEKTIDQFINCYKNMIPAMLKQPDASVSSIDIASEKEKEQILYEFNDTKTDYKRYHNVMEAFQETARRVPDKVALHYKDIRITYSELQKTVCQRAGYLNRMGVKRGTSVAILVEDKIEQIIAILSVLTAGGVFVPIAPDYPESRIRYILEHSEAKVILMDNVSGKLDFPAIKVVMTKEMETDNPIGESVPDYVCNVDAEDLAYIMYTSGTSGKPKGVMVKHKGILRLVIQNKFIELSENDAMLQTSSIVFDASTFEIWNALLLGMTFYLTDKVDLFDYERLKQIIAINHIIVMWLTAPLFRQIGDKDASCFQGLKWLLVGGDALPVDTVNKVQSACKGLRIINGYGPTENTTFSTTYEVKKFIHKAVPIGKPISNSQAYILDELYHILPIGAVGEIYVGGDGLAKGYLKDDKLTEEKFVEIAIGGVKQELYATGDLGYWDSEGNIWFLGRLDNQVKIRGFRIEMDEIYSAVMEQKEINDATIKVHQEEEKCIALYYQSDSMGENSLRRVLKQRLPEYMVPKYIIRVEKIPLNENGKIDTAALNDIVLHYEPEEMEECHEIIFTSDYQKIIYEIWSEVLGVTIEGTDVNFFDAGGNSMYLLKIYEKLNERLGKKITISDLFVYTTIEELASHYEEVQSERHKPVTMQLSKEMLVESENSEKELVQYEFTYELEFLKSVPYEKSMLLFLFAFVFHESAKGEVNINLYDEQMQLVTLLSGLAEQDITSVEDVLKANETLHKRLSKQENTYQADTLNYEEKRLSSNTVRLLYCYGKCPEKYKSRFDILCSMEMEKDTVSLVISFDRNKYKESKMEQLIESYHNMINLVFNNV